MCGSGTLAIEAALVALGRAPGSFRRNFGFMHVRGYREETWKDLKRAAAAAEQARPAFPILATDISEQAVDAARQNARNAGVEEHIEFAVCDYAATPLPPAPGLIMFNPEYGERLGEETALEPVYSGIGDFLKQKAQGYLGYVFTCNLKLAKRIRLHPKRRLILFNANLEGRLLEYELYAGTRDPWRRAAAAGRSDFGLNRRARLRHGSNRMKRVWLPSCPAAAGRPGNATRPPSTR
jgi:23S rRNA G2445 N2-methylase RlmL